MMVMVMMPGLGRRMHTWVVVFFWHGFFSDSALDCSLYLIKYRVFAKLPFFPDCSWNETMRMAIFPYLPDGTMTFSAVRTHVFHFFYLLFYENHKMTSYYS